MIRCAVVPDWPGLFSCDANKEYSSQNILSRIIMVDAEKNMTIGKRVRELRGQRTQVEMADIAGITQGQWSKLEKGIVPKTDVVGKIAKSLGVSIDTILYGTGEKRASPTVNESVEGYSNQPLTRDELHLIRTYRKLNAAEKEKVIEIAELYCGVQESWRNVGGGSVSKESNSK